MGCSATVGITAQHNSAERSSWLVTHTPASEENEILNAVTCLLSGLGALGVRQVVMPLDMITLLKGRVRAKDASSRWPEVVSLESCIAGDAASGLADIASMAALGVRLIVVLGDDAAHRAAATHCANTPLLLLPIALAGNVFAQPRDATIAGLAAALFTTEAVPIDAALTGNKRLVLRRLGKDADEDEGDEQIALVSVCISRPRDNAAAPVDEPSAIETLFLTFAEPTAVGLASVGAAWMPVARIAPYGLRMSFLRDPDTSSKRAHDMGGGPTVRLHAPLAPGCIEHLVMRACERLDAQVPIVVSATRGCIALDGERVVDIRQGETYTVTLDWAGPLTIDVDRILQSFTCSRPMPRYAGWKAVRRAT